MVDPRKRDPRFPDRPFTEDFFLLSEIVQELDQAAEGVENVFDLVDVDEDSLIYFITNRLGTFTEKITLPEPLMELMSPLFKAIYIDAFTMGMDFALRREEEEVKRQSQGFGKSRNEEEEGQEET